MEALKAEGVSGLDLHAIGLELRGGFGLPVGLGDRNDFDRRSAALDVLRKTGGKLAADAAQTQ